MSEADATWDKAAGKAKETAGKVTGDKDLEAEGGVQNVAGKAKDAIEDAKAGVQALGDRISDAIHKKDD